MLTLELLPRRRLQSFPDSEGNYRTPPQDQHEKPKLRELDSHWKSQCERKKKEAKYIQMPDTVA